MAKPVPPLVWASSSSPELTARKTSRGPSNRAAGFLLGRKHADAQEHKKATTPIKPIQREGWRDRIQADLAAQIEAAGTLYGYRNDGVYVARTKRGDRIIRQ